MHPMPEASLLHKVCPCKMEEKKNLCQKWDSNPRPHKRTRNLRSSPIRGQGSSLESGALDHSAILTLVSYGLKMGAD